VTPSRVRAFFALPVLGEPARSLLQAAERVQRAGSRLSPRSYPAEKLHVTLEFLGSVTPATLGALWPVAARLASEQPAIDAHIEGIDAFPRLTRARVLVATISDPKGHLAKLAAALESAAAGHGVAPEEREYRPHVTLARIKRPGNLQGWIERAALEPTAVRFDELRLYRSDVTAEGGRYTVLERAAFRGRP